MRLICDECSKEVSGDLPDNTDAKEVLVCKQCFDGASGTITIRREDVPRLAGKIVKLCDAMTYAGVEQAILDAAIKMPERKLQLGCTCNHQCPTAEERFEGALCDHAPSCNLYEPAPQSPATAWAVFDGLSLYAVSLDRDTARNEANRLCGIGCGRHADYRRVRYLAPRLSARGGE